MDQHAGALFSIEASQDSFVESDGYAKVMVHRHGQPFGQASVSFETLDGDAVGGLDFVGTRGRLTWEHGDTASKVVAVPLVNDATSRYGLHFKHFFVRLVQNTSNTVLDDHGMIAAVHMIDDSAETGFASFAPAVVKPGEENRQERPTRQDVKVHGNMLHNVLEGFDRQINLTVMRIGGNQGNMSVRYRTVGMTAVGGEHFKDAHGILTWAEGDATNRSISLDILDDDNATPSIHHRAFRVVIEHVTFSNGLRSTQIYKGPSQFAEVAEVAEVWISEDDGSGVLSMQQPTLSVTESAGVVNVSVLRSGGSSGAVAVKVRAERGSASRMLPGASLPTSCREAEHKVGHVAAIELLPGQAREVYCNAMEEDESSSASSSASFDESRSGSIFLWDYSTRLWDRKCIEIPEIGI
jgi:chitinase